MTTRPSSSDVSMFLISSKYGLKPKGDYDQPGVNPALAATKSLSKYGLKPKGDYDAIFRAKLEVYSSSKYGLKPKGDYDSACLKALLSTSNFSSKYGLKPKGDYDS